MKRASRKPAVVPAPELRTPRHGLIENELFECANTLFAARGFAGTSLQDIADAMGMTRTALYYYVKNKDEILAKLVAALTEAPARTLAEINANHRRSPLDRLREMVHASVMQQATQPARFRMLLRCEADLPPDVARVHEQGKRRVLAEYVAVIEEGARTGHMRPVDARVAALGIIGLSNWVAWWHHAKDGRTSEEVADQLTEMAVLSVAQIETRKKPGIDGAIALLKQDLEYLEQARAQSREPSSV